MIHSNQRCIVQWKSQPDSKRTRTQIVMEVIEMETKRFAKMKFTVNKSFKVIGSKYVKNVSISLLMIREK